MKNSITDIENTILQWNETSAKDADFDARAFLFQKKEFGHIHRNGDLDIVFGRNITTELLLRELVQKHNYVPKVGITYSVTSEEKYSFAISLLRFSYLIHFIKANIDNANLQNIIDEELAKLPEELSSLLIADFNKDNNYTDLEKIVTEQKVKNDLSL